MTHVEIDYYIKQARVERSKAVVAGFRAFKRAITRAASRIHGGFSHLHQPKVYQ
ncbi:RSP_7527 family protein [Rhodovibrio salinarum]|uniref:RSP_7527 family protein n=1 Tax=Rhodovibrio salinarum TaxID=1087 RepID=UPI0004B29FA9|nr:hypothetical protein [Rhodovibrio salinarum]